MSQKIPLLLAFILLVNSCKDIVFNNPLDPNVSKEYLRILKVVSTPLSGPGDISYDGEKIWKINPFGNVTAIDMESGAIIRTLSIRGGTGLCFLEDKLYVADGSNQLGIIDPLSGELLNQQLSADIYPAYLATGEDAVLAYDLRSSSIVAFDPASGLSEQKFQIPGINVAGMEHYHDGVMLADFNTDSIYLFSLDGELIEVFRSPVSRVTGLTADSLDNFYLFAEDGKIYKVSLP